MGIKILYVFGDSNGMANHVKNKYGMKKCRLKAYATKVLYLIEIFKALNIMFIHRENNIVKIL